MTPIRRFLVSRSAALAALLLAGALCQTDSRGQGPAPDPAQVAETKARYTKYEYKVPMRDGVKLFTAVYVPKDQSQKYPMLMTRTPYSVRPYGEDQYRARLGQSSHYDKSGYIFVFQDVRGCHMSEGKFVNIRPYIPNKKDKQIDESSDTYDTIDWLIKHVPNNNGNVGLMGISYPGFYSSCGLVDAHPALKAVSPQAPVTDWFVGDDYHHNGAFILADSINFLEFFDRPQRGAAANRGGGRMGGMRPRRQSARRLQPLPHARPTRHDRRTAGPRRHRLLEGPGRAPQLRRVVEGPHDPTAPQARQAGRAHRRRLVRLRGSFGRDPGL